MGPQTWPSTWLASGVGVDGHRGWRRFRASDNAGAAAADKRLVRPFLRHFGVPADCAAPEKIRGHHPLGLGSFRHRRSLYCDRAAGFKNRRARHIPSSSVTMH